MTEEQQPFPAEGPDEPAYTGEDDRPVVPDLPGAYPDDPEYAGEDERPVPEPLEDDDALLGGAQSAGQLSDVQSFDDGPGAMPISPEDAVAGAPSAESGRADTLGSGPDAAPAENRRDNEMTP